MTQDEFFMSLALLQAKKGFESNEVPVGAFLVGPKGFIVATYNQVEKNCNVFAHAELLAIEKACKTLQSKYLTDFTLYVTLEPCALCMNAILMTRLKRVCFSAKSPRWGFTVDQLVRFEIYKTSLILSEGLFRIEAEKLLVNFFKLHRN